MEVKNFITIRYTSRDGSRVELRIPNVERIRIYDSVETEEDFTTKIKYPKHHVATFYGSMINSETLSEQMVLIDKVSPKTPSIDSKEMFGSIGYFG